MKARIKATGEIVEVTRIVDRYVMTHHPHTITFEKDELDFEVTDKDEIYNKGWADGWDEAVKSEIPKIHPKLKGSDPDYWTRLEHTYAGMAMQGLMTILPNIGGLEGRTPKDEIVDIAIETAHALIQKLKEKEERK